MQGSGAVAGGQRPRRRDGWHLEEETKWLRPAAKLAARGGGPKAPVAVREAWKAKKDGRGGGLLSSCVPGAKKGTTRSDAGPRVPRRIFRVNGKIVFFSLLIVGYWTPHT